MGREQQQGDGLLDREFQTEILLSSKKAFTRSKEYGIDSTLYVPLLSCRFRTANKEELRSSFSISGRKRCNCLRPSVIHSSSLFRVNTEAIALVAIPTLTPFGLGLDVPFVNKSVYLLS